MMENAFYFHQTKLIAPYKSFQAKQNRVSGEKSDIFAFSGGNFGNFHTEISQI